MLIVIQWALTVAFCAMLGAITVGSIAAYANWMESRYRRRELLFTRWAELSGGDHQADMKAQQEVRCIVGELNRP